MMTTALLTFLGLSTCATLMIVAAVVVGARRNRVAYATASCETAEELAANRSGAFVPAFN